MSTFNSFLSRSTVLGALLAAALGQVSNYADAAVVVYNNQAAFAAAMPGLVVDNLIDLAAGSYLQGPVGRDAGIHYTVSAIDQAGYGPGQGADGLFTLQGSAGGVLLSTNFASSTLRFDAFGRPVKGIGGYFFGTDFDGAATGGTLTFTIKDSSGVYAYALSDRTSSSYIGFGTDSRFESLTISTAQGGQQAFATAGAIALSAVPEPSTVSMMALALAGLALSARRRS